MGFKCNYCETPINSRTRLQISGSDESIFETEYECDGCGAIFNIEISDPGRKLVLRATAVGADLPENAHSVTLMERKDTLYAEGHSAKDLFQGLREVTKALSVMNVNYQRLKEAHEGIQQVGGLDISEKFDLETSTDLHNYLASAYSFDKILSAVLTDIPTDGPVVSCKETYEEERKVVNGLRAFAQHNLNLPFTYSDYHEPQAESRRRSITVDLDDVEEYNYYEGSSHHYKKVVGDKVDIDLVMEGHQRAANQLVKTIWERAVETRGDEMEEYIKLGNHIPTEHIRGI